jgi:hypothetical protein
MPGGCQVLGQLRRSCQGWRGKEAGWKTQESTNPGRGQSGKPRGKSGGFVSEAGLKDIVYDRCARRRQNTSAGFSVHWSICFGPPVTTVDWVDVDLSR